MKTVISLLIAASLCGCVAGGNIAHEDSPGTTKHDAPTLCRDGTTPPCNDRG